ncbi:MAG: hypothetical protein Q4G40_07550, partial [Brachybacterium sp.]|nr:hypothetical protein [Brachybacterium sp.]
MRLLKKILLRGLAALLVLVLVVVGVRLVNGWRYGSAEAGPDPRSLATYDLDQDGMSIEHVEGGYMNGFHLVPDEVTRDGVVVTFGGSEGSPDFARAVQLAGEGYEVYALFFFGQENQQAELESVPVDFFTEVTARIETDAARPGPLTVIGGSKGAELALVLAAADEALDSAVTIDNVVLYAPTIYSYQGLVFSAEAPPSWTVDGQPVPFLSFQEASLGALAGQLSAMAFNYPVSYRSTYASMVDGADAAAEEAARLDPNAVPGGMLVFAGGDDAMWPSDVAAEQIG